MEELRRASRLIELALWVKSTAFNLKDQLRFQKEMQAPVKRIRIFGKDIEIHTTPFNTVQENLESAPESESSESSSSDSSDEDSTPQRSKKSHKQSIKESHEQRIRELKKYLSLHGSLVGMRSKNSSLYYWLRDQKRRHNIGRMEKNLQRELEILGIKLDSPTSTGKKH